ncbi:MAG: 1,4-dihydroxy-2-naphthoate octaprenyltransferase [Coriobacteriales bacterium]|nr:1,4-dihydroxy-2-naphthoate octaprenyltransferase [Coriobacteriales bacterium]
MKVWIEAMRLRALPLSISCVILASAMAAFYGSFRWQLFIPMLLMTMCLQISSNFANEYGDFEHGVDNQDRIGPIRGMQRGEITKEQMKRALIILACVIAVLIILLLALAFGLGNLGWSIAFLVLGGLCIWASISYTTGDHPYGYYGLGDFSAFFCYGIVAIIGGFFLHAKTIEPLVILPALGFGLLVAAMVSYNNLRDIQNDSACGKRTVANMLGIERARIYQVTIVVVGLLFFLAFPIAAGITTWWRYAFVLIYPLFFTQLARAMKVTDLAEYDAFMRPHSLKTAALAVLFSLCMVL